MSFGLLAQSDRISVAGTVMDELGETLIGVSIQIKGTSTGIVTDYDGRFKMENVPAGSTLVFTYLGYKPLEIRYISNQ